MVATAYLVGISFHALHLDDITEQQKLPVHHAKTAAEDTVKYIRSLNGFAMVFEHLFDEIRPFFISGSDGACEWERSELQAGLVRK
jgi:hypothetical protein